MITFLIVVGLGALCGLLVGWEEGSAAPFFGLAFVGAVLGFFVALITGAIIYHHHYWRVKRQVPLVSLADGSDIHGIFFLGTGTVDSSPSFTWYQRDSANSYVRKDVDASISTIHYLSSGRPYYIVRTKTIGGGFWRTWGFNPNNHSSEDDHYDFYVPRGSIIQSYRLDNK